jgi:hypothetical protein
MDTNVVAVTAVTTVRDLLIRVEGQPSRSWTWVVVPTGGAQYAVVRMNELAEAAVAVGAAILDMTLAQVPGLLQPGQAVQRSASLNEAQALARSNPGSRVAVMDGDQAVGVLDYSPRRARPLPLDLWALAAGGARFTWPYDDLELARNFTVVDRLTTVSELTSQLDKDDRARGYVIVSWDEGTYRVMGAWAELAEARQHLGRAAGYVRMGDLPTLPPPAPALEEGEVRWGVAKDRMRAAPGRRLVILKHGQPIGVLSDEARGVPQAPKTTEPGAPQRPPTVYRYSDVDFPRRTTVRVPVDLKVGLTVQPRRPEAQRLAFAPTTPEAPFDVDVFLLFSPDDFELDGDFRRQLRVPPDGDSNYEVFRLTPLTEGSRELTLDFHHKGTSVGQVVVKTTVQPAGQPVASDQPAELAGGILNFGRRPPDITLSIVQVRGEDRAYRYLIDTPNPELLPDPGSSEDDWIVRLASDPAGYIQVLVADLNAWAKRRSADGVHFEEDLRNRGAYLYEELFPPALKRWYWDKVYPLRQQGRSLSLLIVSSEPVIPWELVRPAEPGRPGGFLCEDFVLARWVVPEPPAPDHLDLARLALVVPPSRLAGVPEEVTFVKDLPLTVEEIPPRLWDLMDILKSPGYDALHIVGHGRYNPQVPDRSIVPMEDQPFTPDRIAGEHKTLFEKEHPLVFLNACEVARGGFALSGLGGWAPALIGAGASIFLGSTWRVTSLLATRFAEAFYSALLVGDSVGEAMRKARLAIRPRPDEGTDPSWLGYALYAHPLAKVS